MLLEGSVMVLPISIMFPIPSRNIEEMDLGSDLYIYHHLGLGDMIHLNVRTA